MKQISLERLKKAENYIKADKSDPFLAARVRTHMRNGICGFTIYGEDAWYEADRTVDGNGNIIYVNLKRP